jgi:hypothetical protein
MGDTKAELPPPIETEEQALRWAEQMVSDCEVARAACDVPLLTNAKGTADALRKRERVYLMKHGAALGAIGALLRCQKISPVAYNTLAARVRMTLIGTVTGSVSL